MHKESEAKTIPRLCVFLLLRTVESLFDLLPINLSRADIACICMAFPHCGIAEPTSHLYGVLYTEDFVLFYLLSIYYIKYFLL